jgi:hypothetical protein
MEFDLSFIKDAGIGSGPVEVHWDALQGSSFKPFLRDLLYVDYGC